MAQHGRAQGGFVGNLVVHWIAFAGADEGEFFFLFFVQIQHAHSGSNIYKVGAYILVVNHDHICAGILQELLVVFLFSLFADQKQRPALGPEIILVQGKADKLRLARLEKAVDEKQRHFLLIHNKPPIRNPGWGPSSSDAGISLQRPPSAHPPSGPRR